MKFTAKQVEEAIEAFEESDAYQESDKGYEDYGGVLQWLKSEGSYSSKKEPTVAEVPGLGNLEYVSEYGGEGQGDDYWVVFKIGDQYFRKDGWYASYDGGELDGELYEVKPVQVTVTEYQAIKND